MITESEIATSRAGFYLQGSSNSSTVEAVFKSDRLSSVGVGFFLQGYSEIYWSQVVQTPSDTYGVLASGNTNYVYSDNTSHLAPISFTPLSWSTQ
jgi:hypothetical protein